MPIVVLYADITKPASDQLISGFATTNDREDSQGFNRSERQKQSLLARALIRAGLAAHSGQGWDQINLIKNNNGAPYLKGPAGQVLPHISITHSHHMVAVALSDKWRIGIDLQLPKKGRNIKGLGNVLTESQTPLSPSRFYELWSLNEAFAKASGKDLTFPAPGFLKDLSFTDNDIQTHQETFGFKKVRLGETGYSLIIAVCDD